MHITIPNVVLESFRLYFCLHLFPYAISCKVIMGCVINITP